MQAAATRRRTTSISVTHTARAAFITHTALALFLLVAAAWAFCTRPTAALRAARDQSKMRTQTQRCPQPISALMWTAARWLRLQLAVQPATLRRLTALPPTPPLLRLLPLVVVTSFASVCW